MSFEVRFVRFRFRGGRFLDQEFRLRPAAAVHRTVRGNDEMVLHDDRTRTVDAIDELGRGDRRPRKQNRRSGCKRKRAH